MLGPQEASCLPTSLSPRGDPEATAAEGGIGTVGHWWTPKCTLLCYLLGRYHSRAEPVLQGSLRHSRVAATGASLKQVLLLWIQITMACLMPSWGSLLRDPEPEVPRKAALGS